MGTFYLFGWGMTQNYPEALRWLRKAADQGNDVAQRNIAIVYLQGGRTAGPRRSDPLVSQSGREGR